MTEKQKRFVEEYLIDLNATQAAIRAGYSPISARQSGTDNMTDPSIRAHIDKSLAERSRRTGVNADRVIEELAKIAFANPDDFVDFDDANVRECANKADTAAISSIKVKHSTTVTGETTEREIKLCDKNKALETLCRHLGILTDNVNHSGDVGVQIVNDIPKDNS